MILLDGKKTSLERAEILKKKVSALDFVPKLVIVRVGDREDSLSYVRKKIAYGKKLGINTEMISFPAEVSQEELEQKVSQINADKEVSGIIVQLPLPDNLDENKVIAHINPKKDTDGLTSENMFKLMSGEKGIVPATPRGILTLLNEYSFDVAGKNVVVIGRSLLVGKSAALNFLNNNATVTIAHSKTKNLQEVTKKADILVVAIGKPNFINKDYVSEGQIVVDVGISPLNDEINGDVDMESIKDIVTAVSPVPGGVGPMTVISLFENLIDTLDIE